LIHQLLQHPRDVIQFVQALQNIVAAIPQRVALIHSPDGFAGAPRAYRSALLIGHRENNAAVHPACDIRLTISALKARIFGVRFPARGHFNLVRRGAVLYQKFLHRSGSSEAELFVILRGAEVVGVAFHFDAITWVLMQ
jgi:hypothetical protein